MTTSRPTEPPRQRWRITFRREAAAASAPPRDAQAAWEEALSRTALPLAAAERAPGRPRLSFGAALGAGVPGEAEVVDLFLTETLPVARVREALVEGLPEGDALVDLHDVWVGERPLPAQVSALAYRVTVATREGQRLDGRELAEASTALLAATSLPRRRPKADRSIAYDLRPLLASIEVLDPGPPPRLRIVVRVDPALGTGRPDEVVAALGERLGTGLEIRDLVREAVLLGS